MPEPKLPNRWEGWIVVIFATIAAMITEFVVIKAMRGWFGE